MRIQITKDHNFEAAYIELSSRPVAHSIELGADTIVDLDGLNCVVGIEILALGRLPKFDDLDRLAHVLENDRPKIQLALRHLSRMRATSSSLTEESRIVVDGIPA
ncbi:DUF2283 domain-containing protein [Corynebacterium breve]|uniref:DUF2283 domain-containing protein n=1 Tax=Corynebacterium breve TaxID=3049799 RepID=A0ABY8VH38_9CORY|nr:DUF2283 domain-containing protein [Corynebacterium breve]WIM67958.1 DUF2283 domain-containing protein [Corynebacterium breve]